MYNRFFQFAGISMRIESEKPLEIVDYFTIFEKKDEKRPHVIYKIKKIESPIVFEEKAIFQNERMKVYLVEGMEYRQFPWWTENENYPMTLKCGDMDTVPLRYELLLTKPQIEMFAKRFHFAGCLALERVMLQYDTFQLHASIIEIDGKGILFTAPSGTGKSTQASLWEKYENAVIINGDKTMIQKRKGDFWGCGSPYAGTSKIYRDLAVPIHSIVVLAKGKENKLTRLSKSQAFMYIYREAAVNIWNENFMTRFAGLLEELVCKVPVYHFACLPDKSAVEVLKNTLF